MLASMFSSLKAMSEKRISAKEPIPEPLPKRCIMSVKGTAGLGASATAQSCKSGREHHYNPQRGTVPLWSPLSYIPASLFLSLMPYDLPAQLTVLTCSKIMLTNTHSAGYNWRNASSEEFRKCVVIL